MIRTGWIQERMPIDDDDWVTVHFEHNYTDDFPVRLQTPREVLAEAEKCERCNGDRVVVVFEAHGDYLTEYAPCPDCIEGYKPTEAVRWALEMEEER